MNTLQDKGVGMQTMGPDGDRYRALKRQQQLMRQQQLNFVEQGNANAHAAAYGPQTAGEAALDSNYISSPSAAAAGSGAAGNWAGNNVGNVKDVNGNWRRFPSQQAGIAASAGQLLRYSTGAFKGGRKRTLREIVAHMPVVIQRCRATSSRQANGRATTQISSWTCAIRTRC
jgi:hypothetical protein